MRDYKIAKNKVDITMFFEGGETTIILEQKKRCFKNHYS